MKPHALSPPNPYASATIKYDNLLSYLMILRILIAPLNSLVRHDCKLYNPLYSLLTIYLLARAIDNVNGMLGSVLFYFQLLVTVALKISNIMQSSVQLSEILCGNTKIS